MGWAWEQLWEWLTLAQIQSRKGGDENQGLQPPRSQHEQRFHKLDHKYCETVFSWEKCFVLWTMRVSGAALAPSRCLSMPLPTLLWRRRPTDTAEMGIEEKFLFGKGRDWAGEESLGKGGESSHSHKPLPYLSQGPAEAVSLQGCQSGKSSQHKKQVT